MTRRTPRIKNPTQRQQTGKLAEQLAVAYLQDRGLHLVTQNFFCKTGELDIIMTEQELLVFIEVRYRNELSHGSPLETITPAKQKKLLRSAQFFLQRQFGNEWPACRFDALGISGTLNQNPKIEWVKNAFSA